jgi:hypothetical protein
MDDKAPKESAPNFKRDQDQYEKMIRSSFEAFLETPSGRNWEDTANAAHLYQTAWMRGRKRVTGE